MLSTPVAITLDSIAQLCLQLCPQYDELTSKHIDQLRQLTKQIQDARIARDNDAIKASLEVRRQHTFSAAT